MARSHPVHDLQVSNTAPLSGGGGRWFRHGFRFDTCLRQLAAQLAHAPGTPAAREPEQPAEHYRGVDAYQFLMEVATGLRSEVPGETNVFGQFKTAVEDFRRATNAADNVGLIDVLQQVVRDTRAIRREHLQGIGGANYGSLVRKLIQPADNDRILFIGAGNLAQSILPLFRNFTVGLWNRHPSPLQDDVACAFQLEQRASAARWAQHVVVTTPPEPNNDSAWLRALGGGEICTTVHLGHRRSTHAPWRIAQRCFDLDDVFELRAQLDDFRSLQIERARAACRAAALSLDPSAAPAIRAQAVRA